MQTTGTTTEPVYRRLPIQASPDQPCRTAALAKVFRSFSRMLSRHERVLTMRFDVRLPDLALCAPKRHHVRSCLGEYQQRFEEEGADPLCVWIDRPTEPDLPSIHSGLILLDGDRVQPLDSPLDTAEDWWGRVVDPPDSSVWIDPHAPHDPRPLFGSGVMIDRGEPDWWRTFQYCFHWASDMAHLAPGQEAWSAPVSSRPSLQRPADHRAAATPTNAM